MKICWTCSVCWETSGNKFHKTYHETKKTIFLICVTNFFQTFVIAITRVFNKILLCYKILCVQPTLCLILWNNSCQCLALPSLCRCWIEWKPPYWRRKVHAALTSTLTWSFRWFIEMERIVNWEIILFSPKKFQRTSFSNQFLGKLFW